MARAEGGSGVKETLESILVAFILAFTFRVFVVEAFVIPTGSMAPTLLGAHLRYHCPRCGYQFDVNYSSSSSADDADIPAIAHKTYTVYCPNCGYKIPKYDPADPENDASNPWVYYGDRILVLKYAYLFQEPQRWDVVVFKSPADPLRQHYQQNYIKRLIGKPNEQVVIMDGDVYVRRGDDEPWTVQTKPYDVQQALWRIIYDNDYYPREPGAQADLLVSSVRPWQQPWTCQGGAAGWDLGHDAATGRVFHFASDSGGGAIYFDPTANPHQYAFTDFLAYDITRDQDERGAPYDTYDHPPRPPIKANVSDLKLALDYQREAGNGALQLELSKLNQTFIASVTPQGVQLLRRARGDDNAAATAVPQDGQDPTERLQEAPLPDLGGKPMRLEFTNVDYQVTLRINGQVVLQTTPQQYHPDFAALLEAYERNEQSPPPAVRITARQQRCSLGHISLWRDVYYINRDVGLSWGIPEDYPQHIARLGPDDYFVLGDNSVMSQDARYWQTPVYLPNEDLYDTLGGRVPRRFMLGKAFFVYWPAGYRPVPTLQMPVMVPNFGEMRFIH